MVALAGPCDSFRHGSVGIVPGDEAEGVPRDGRLRGIHRPGERLVALLLFDERGRIVSVARRSTGSSSPGRMVEQDAEEISATCSRWCRMPWRRPASSSPTWPLWGSPTSGDDPGVDRHTGRPIYNRSAGRTPDRQDRQQPRRRRGEGPLPAKTGLPSRRTSRAQIQWILDHVEGLGARGEGHRALWDHGHLADLNLTAVT